MVQLCARLGQTNRAASLISGSGIDSNSTLPAVAGKYPVATGLREQALERSNASVSAMYGSSSLRIRSSAAIKPKPRAWRSVLAVRWMARSNLTAWIR
jgi:hypothetical protein